MNAVDILGTPIEVGDFVAAPDGNLRILFGVVLKINEKTIKVAEVGSSYLKRVPHGNYVKLDQDKSLLKSMAIK